MFQRNVYEASVETRIKSNLNIELKSSKTLRKITSTVYSFDSLQSTLTEVAFRNLIEINQYWKSENIICIVESLNLRKINRVSVHCYNFKNLKIVDIVFKIIFNIVSSQRNFWVKM